MNDNYYFSVGCIVRKETGITARVSRMAGIRCQRNRWFLLLEMEYISSEPVSDLQENSEALFCELSNALMQNDCMELTKIYLEIAVS